MKTYEANRAKFTEKTILDVIAKMETVTLEHPAGEVRVGSYGKKRKTVIYFTTPINGKLYEIERTSVSKTKITGKTFDPKKMADGMFPTKIEANSLWTVEYK